MPLNLYFFQLFYYESISVDGLGPLATAVVPCLSSWGEDEITEREKRERKLGGYGLGEVCFKFSTCYSINYACICQSSFSFAGDF